MKKNTINQRLKFLRVKFGYSRVYLCRKYNISINTFKSWEMLDKPLSDIALNKCLKIFYSEGITVSKEWLLTGSDTTPSFININKTMAFDSSIIDSDLYYFKQIFKDLVIHIIDSNDMTPYYKLGDYVCGRWLKKRELDLAINKDCIIHLMDDSLLFKRLIRDKEGNYNLCSLNPYETSSVPVLYKADINTIAPVIWHKKQ